MGKKADVALYTVGTVRDEALLFRLNYLTDLEKKDYKHMRWATFVHDFLMNLEVLQI